MFVNLLSARDKCVSEQAEQAQRLTPHLAPENTTDVKEKQ